MRAVDADLLKEEAESFSVRFTGIPHTKKFDIFMKEMIKSFVTMIEDQPTLDIEKMLVANCKECEYDNTESSECMICMRTYSDCYHKKE